MVNFFIERPIFATVIALREPVDLRGIASAAEGTRFAALGEASGEGAAGTSSSRAGTSSGGEGGEGGEAAPSEATLGLLQEFVAGAVGGWELALDEILGGPVQEKVSVRMRSDSDEVGGYRVGECWPRQGLSAMRKGVALFQELGGDVERDRDTEPRQHWQRDVGEVGGAVVKGDRDEVVATVGLLESRNRVVQRDDSAR